MVKKIEASDPKRLSLLRVDKIQFPKGSDCTVVTVTFEYEPVCCNGQHEMVDALIAVHSLLKGKNE